MFKTTINGAKTRKMIYSIACVTFSVILVFGMLAACEGPQGPEGPQGSQGPQGPQGPKGPKGTANVIYSDWIEVPGNTWEKDTTSSANAMPIYFRTHNITAKSLSKDIMNKGIVNVYMDIRKGIPKVKHIWTLPKLFGDTKLTYDYKLQNIRLRYRSLSKPQQMPSQFGLTAKFRYVLIPGGTAAKSKFSKEEVKAMTYKEVHNHFSGKAVSN